MVQRSVYGSYAASSDRLLRSDVARLTRQYLIDESAEINLDSESTVSVYFQKGQHNKLISKSKTSIGIFKVLKFSTKKVLFVISS